MTLKALLLAAALVAPAVTAAQPTTLRPDQQAFRELYKELVETDTTLSAGSCTLAAERLAARLKAAGYKDGDITLFAEAAHPKEGGMVVVVLGSDKKAKPILLLGHLDVVEAKRADWTRDPFVMVEEDGYYYGRGTFDDKSQAAIWTDTLIRYKTAGKTPRRTLKLALTCGEETTNAFNGADWLAKNRPELIAAEFAINEGGGGQYDKAGKPLALGVQVGEKTVQNFQLQATNRGGHSSVPRPDNAITDLSRAIVAVNTHEFPVQFNDTTRSFFTLIAKATPPQVGEAITTLLANPADAAANAIVSQDPTFHSTLRTTCVTTLVDAGHANNALAQRATANVNCRMFPGTDPEKTRADLAAAIGNPGVTITLTPPIRPVAVSPPLNPAVIGPMKTLAAKHFPGVPMGVTMSTGATDAIFLSPIGIPTYGAPGLFIDPDGNGMHGLNERIRINSLMQGRDYLDDLVHTLAD
ncbi:M20/M25/M40 family metallo-hydrolase [Sandarakinorhabdus sp. DWP1-3-1]|uniref:M20/M25/M40 family metallo-hydrolase n=1 Tax=Sandarakinorhabdus sp. DWP1-3-1 TaxID=2804627 RepID=UPI003CFAEFBD